MKEDGKLTGQEIAVGGNHYMRGDRILINETSKELGIINGDLGEILAASKDRFIIAIKNTDTDSKIVEFNPSEYSGFRHGYATTVFKAQGASIKDVYVFHNGFAGLRNSYVALSRNINELKLYVNSKETISTEHLIKQLSYYPESSNSLHYLTEDESMVNKQNAEFIENIGVVDSLLLGAYNFAVRNITKFTDKYMPSSEYYNYQEPHKTTEAVENVIDRVYEQNQNIGFERDVIEEKLVVGGNINSSNSIAEKFDKALSEVANTLTTSSSAKTKFYKNVGYARNNLQRQQQQAAWSSQTEELRRETRFKAERIARDLLGEPNRHLSNGRELRFGEHGKIAVRISGERAGNWYDFSRDKGGDLFDLVQDKQGGDFKRSAEYLRDSVGIRSTNNLYLVHSHQINDKYVDYHKAKAEEHAIEARRIKYSKDLYAKAKEIDTERVANVYLSKVRGISCSSGDDIKTTSIFDKSSNKKLPAIIAFARDTKGNITGGQQLLLDDQTNNKANVNVPKKSFGKIAGSFVTINNGNDKAAFHNITIIAEGLETALSIKQAGIDAKILCSLGISNIKNYVPQEGEKVIIAADNDGEASITNNVIDKAVEVLSEHAIVKVVKPDIIGDFNDILTNTNSSNIDNIGYNEGHNMGNKNALILGEQKIRESFAGTLEELRVSNLDSLDKKKEEDYIKSNLDELAKAKREAKTAKETLKALTKEQEFLASLHNNLKYTDYSQKLLEDINKAHALKSTNEINYLYNTVNYAYKEKILSADDLIEHFKSNNHLDIIHNNISKICYKSHCDTINDHCNKIASGETIMHKGHEFDCIVEYLEHWKDNVNHKMLPVKQIDNIIQQELDQQREHDHYHHELTL